MRGLLKIVSVATNLERAPRGWDHAHQLINTSNAVIHYLCMSTLQAPEVVFYPDSRKVAFMSPSGGPGNGPIRQIQRLGESLSYYEGEDE